MSRGIIPTVTEKVNARLEQTQAPRSTMLHYAVNCQASFEEEPFNEADSLILSWMSYLRIPEEVIPKRELNSPVTPDNRIFGDTDSCRIRDLLKQEYYPDMLRDIWSPDETLAMLMALAGNPRFRDMRISMRREELDHSSAKQFAAVTYQLRPDLTYIAYRGTDKTITGWEEDFRLCLLDPVPSQTLSADYLNAVGRIFRGTLLVGGHSKGGNLAVYAAANASPEVQERIRTVYTHDGPGFLKEDLAQEGFRRIQSRIHKTAPQFSIFGMLMHQETEPKIIYSYEKGIMQHNAASWKTEGYGLAEYRYPNRTAQALKNKLNNWIDGLSNEERKQFIDTVFEILDETGHEKFGDLKTNLTEIIPVVIREFQKLDPSMQMFLFDLLKQLIFASEENKDPKAEPNRSDAAWSRDYSNTEAEPNCDASRSSDEDTVRKQYEREEKDILSEISSAFDIIMQSIKEAGHVYGRDSSSPVTSQKQKDYQDALDELNGVKKSAPAANSEEMSIQELMKLYDDLS